MTPFELGWLAGLWEGEGCFSLGFNRGNKSNPEAHRITAQISRTDLEPMERVVLLLGGVLYPQQSKKLRSDGSPELVCYRWSSSGWRARDLMQLLQPHLSPRRQARIEECLNWWVPIRDRPNRIKEAA